MTSHPTVVIGAGPVGLAAAAHLQARGLAVLVLESGEHAASNVRRWGHVRLFSPWSELTDPAAERLLDAAGWHAPEPSDYPSGRQWVREYLQPLADAIVAAGVPVRYGARVTGVARRGRDLVVDAGREDEPLTLLLRTAAGTERVAASAVIDATGTCSSPNPLGGDGLPAVGELEAADRVSYGTPDLDDPATRARYAGRHVVVAGTGASAHTALVSLGRLAEAEPGTRITWLVRRSRVGDAFGGAEADQLVERGALGSRARAVAEGRHVRTVTGFRTAQVRTADDGTLSLDSFDGQVVDGIDQVVAVTGYRPDLSWLSEVRLALDPTLQAPVALAPLIDPNLHSCGTVSPHGAAELAQPEPGVYLAGMKSYGRAPTFLALTGYEQVRSIAAAIAGDHDAAARVELTLPETGVCGGAGLFEEPDAGDPGAGCCARPASMLTGGANG